MSEISLINLLLNNIEGPFGWLIVGLLFLAVIQRLFLKPAGKFLESYLMQHAETEKERTKNDIKAQIALQEVEKALETILRYFEEQKQIMDELLIYLRKHNGKKREEK